MPERNMVNRSSRNILTFAVGTNHGPSAGDSGKQMQERQNIELRVNPSEHT